MPEQATVEELKQLPSVGETTAKVLQDAGYGSFEELVSANPMDIHRECDIVLSSTTHIISAAVEYVKGDCPQCSCSDMGAAWQEYSEAIEEEDDAEVVCERCAWYGTTDELE